jgi:tRNA-splicing ligase RtcB
MTDTYDAGDVTLEKRREFVWEIPREGDMNVPARVLASEALLDEISEDLTLTQLKNATHLPGMTKHALCMPDGHQGYGFPVGGVGAIDAENGCISPGAIGYDINCLSGETEVRLSFGRRTKISELGDQFENERAVVAGERLTDSDIRLFTESEARTVYRLETDTGQTVEATADHPFATPAGMTELSDLRAGDTVFVQPFRGIEHEPPEEFVVLSEEDFGDDDSRLLEALKERDLLPLRSTDDAFNRLLKLVGFHTGGGAFCGGEHTWFYGDPRDLERIREDVESVGFTPSRIPVRDRHPDTDESEFETTGDGLRTSSTALKRVLQELGAPPGSKIEHGFETPDYFDRLTDWQQALYYSAYFGAEMSVPSTQHDTGLSRPRVTQTRTAETADTGRAFFEDVTGFLEELGIEVTVTEELDTNSNRAADVVRLRLEIENDSHNLVRFLSTVGYRYDEQKRRTATKAIRYLRLKEVALERRERTRDETGTIADGGTPVSEARSKFGIDDRPGRPYEGSFPGFEEFCEEVTVSDDLTVEATVTGIEEGSRTSVYDIGVEHDAHNFLAGGFVVSNCGVRMIKTDLTYDDLQGRERELVDGLFDAVPAGLGGGGVAHLSREELGEVLERGVEWAVEKDYAVTNDLEHCEDEGRFAGADPDAVSEKAKNRGKEQVGSLGSGNHFLEVQRVTDVFLEDVAKAYGLRENQVVVLVHCGSRGLGHQVCTDYLRKIEKEHGDLLERLPDKELAAAPAGSALAAQYYGAMGAAINFAWTNRQLITHRTREVFERVFGEDWETLGMDLLYDVAHNIGKRETHEVDGEDRELYVHRKGATRAFPAGRPEIPPAHRDVGQPVIIPGSMGAGSYVLRGGEASMHETFGSTAHGAGRLMSRTKAKQTYWGEDVRDDLEEQQHVYVKAQSGATIAEEAPGVYKNVDEVVRVSDALGIGDKVARTFPVCNIKG